MTRDADPKAARLYDKRTIERNIKKGLISRKDYEKHLKSLNDVADKGVYGAIEGPEPAGAEAVESDEADEQQDGAGEGEDSGTASPGTGNSQY